MANLYHPEKATKRIGALLIESDLITEKQLQEALALQQKQGGKIVETLISLGYLNTAEFTRFLARQGLPAVDLSQYEIPRDLLELVPKSLANKHKIVPIDKLGSHLTIAMECPLDSHAIEEIREATGLKVRPVLCSAKDVEAVLARYYREPVDEEAAHLEKLHAVAGLKTFPLPPAAPVSMPALASTAELPEAGGPVSMLSAPLKLKGISTLIRNLESLPTLPDTVMKVRQALNSPYKGARDVSQIILSDPPIAAKLLSIVNSPAYGLPQKVKDIGLAVSLLGIDETCSIVFSVAVIQAMGGSKQEAYRRFWNSALRCARISNIIALARGEKLSGAVFSAGLLHDIGKLALIQVVPQRYESIPSELFGMDLLAAEEEMIGLTHAEAGYILADYWNLPEEIVEAIRHHHHPERAEKAPGLVATVTVADVLTQADRVLVRECGGAFTVLKSSPDIVVEIMRAGLGLFDESIRIPSM